MDDVVIKTCAKCNGDIIVDVSDIKDVVKRGIKYYHKQCFLQHVDSRIGTASAHVWQKALLEIDVLENNAKTTILNKWAKDALNEYLLGVYDVIAVPDRFFQVIAELSNGKYKKKRCNPVGTFDLFEAWKWAQHNLDKIAKNNKAKHIGPMNDEERILYDLAIVVRKLPVFFEYRKQKEAEVYELKNIITHAEVVDITKIGQTKQETRRDISDVADDLFVE